MLRHRGDDSLIVLARDEFRIMLGECAGEKPANHLGDHVAVRKNGTLLDSEARAEILRRIEALTPRSERKWGRMTPHQMVCHLSDACRAALGDRRVSVIGTLWERTMIRWLAIHTNVKWPQGVRTVRRPIRKSAALVQPSLRATSMNCDG